MVYYNPYITSYNMGTIVPYITQPTCCFFFVAHVALIPRNLQRSDPLNGPPKPEYLIAGSQLTQGSVGKVPFNS